MTSPAKTGRVMTVEALAKQKLKENYGDMKEEEQNVITVNGLTLFQTLLRDCQRQADGDPIIFGKWYHHTLRCVFSRQGLHPQAA